LETSGYIDIFATKGMEYVFILGFIVVLVFFWKFMNRSGKPTRPSAIHSDSDQRSFRRCKLPRSLYYHQGHSWVEPESPDVARIGIDDFAQKLIGRADFIELPSVGAFLKQGEKGWKLGCDSTEIDILSPVDGEVLAINNKALDDPQIVNHDPFGNGWLLKVRVPKMQSNLTNLLTGKLAALWMKENIENFCLKMSEGTEPATQVGPMPGNETAEEPSQDEWNELAREFFLCK
jgi:glycine cleavage system H protein